MRNIGIVTSLLILVAATVAVSVGQREFRWNRNRSLAGRNGVPEWKIAPEFSDDVFTFVRIKYNSDRGGRRWATDHPDSDLNFSYRLQQLTSLQVDPKGKILELTDEELFDYPFIYIIEPGRLKFTDDEVQALRRYLLNGGFLMVDDFWGESEWDNLYSEIKRVFPDREPTELPLACIAHRAGVRGRGEGGLVEFLAGGVDLGLP